MTLQPYFNEKNIPVVFSSDDNYAPYLGVAIKSLIQNVGKTDNYDICILDGGISDKHKEWLLSMIQSNVSIRFIDISHYINQFPENFFPLSSHFTIATYYRFFLPDLLNRYDKVCYIDCDVIILKDIADLYDIDVDSVYMAVVRDIENLIWYEVDSDYRRYIDNTLHLRNYTRYFNAGCLVCNLKKMREDNITKELIDCLKQIKKPLYCDQCVLNAVCSKSVTYLPFNWNYMWHTAINGSQKLIPENAYIEQYMAAGQNPYLIHFTGTGIKPWFNPDLPNADKFWHYAKQTPFYEKLKQETDDYVKMKKLRQEEIILNDSTHLTRLRYAHWKYKILSALTYGKRRQKYLKKTMATTDRIQKAVQFLNQA